MIYLKLLWSFIQVGMFSVGGGYAAMPLIQAQVVTKHSWLSMSEFIDLITIAEMTPGPIAVNSATFVGIRVAGLFGAFVATFGVILPSLIIVSLLSYLYYRFKSGSAIQAVLSCLRPTVVALIAGAGISILSTALATGHTFDVVNLNYLNLILFCGALIALRKFKKNPILVMASCGALSVVTNVVLQMI